MTGARTPHRPDDLVRPRRRRRPYAPVEVRREAVRAHRPDVVWPAAAQAIPGPIGRRLRGPCRSIPVLERPRGRGDPHVVGTRAPHGAYGRSLVAVGIEVLPVAVNDVPPPLSGCSRPSRRRWARSRSRPRDCSRRECPGSPTCRRSTGAGRPPRSHCRCRRPICRRARWPRLGQRRLLASRHLAPALAVPVQDAALLAGDVDVRGTGPGDAGEVFVGPARRDLPGLSVEVQDRSLVAGSPHVVRPAPPEPA